MESLKGPANAIQQMFVFAVSGTKARLGYVFIIVRHTKRDRFLPRVSKSGASVKNLGY
jgi:hypothetical protein